MCAAFLFSWKNKHSVIHQPPWLENGMLVASPVLFSRSNATITQNTLLGFLPSRSTCKLWKQSTESKLWNFSQTNKFLQGRRSRVFVSGHAGLHVQDWLLSRASYWGRDLISLLANINFLCFPLTFTNPRGKYFAEYNSIFHAKLFRLCTSLTLWGAPSSCSSRNESGCREAHGLQKDHKIFQFHAHCK